MGVEGWRCGGWGMGGTGTIKSRARNVTAFCVHVEVCRRHPSVHGTPANQHAHEHMGNTTSTWAPTPRPISAWNDTHAIHPVTCKPIHCIQNAVMLTDIILAASHFLADAASGCSTGVAGNTPAGVPLYRRMPKADGAPLRYWGLTDEG